MSRTERKKPKDLAPSPWPETASADPVGEVARKFVLDLTAAIGEKSLRSAANEAGVNHSTLIRVLQGEAWPDLETIAKLGLTVDVWPTSGH